MTILFLLLMMIYGVDGQKATSQPQNNKTTLDSDKKQGNDNNFAKMIQTPERIHFKNFVQDLLSNSRIADCKTYNRQEKNVLSTILNLTNEDQTYSFMDLAVAVVMMNRTRKPVQVSAPNVPGQTKMIQMWIPTEPFQNVPQAQRKVGVVTYMSDQQFNPKNDSIMSKVIRIEVYGGGIANLTDPLKIHFPVNNYTNQSNGIYMANVGDSKWKTDGCNTTQFSDDIVECSCDHMTPFAVLLVEVGNNIIDASQWEILSYISYVGCSLSTLFSASTILSFIFNKNIRAEVSSSIHVSLSAALFLLNLSFMLSEWAATLSMNKLCVFIAVTIHYSLLSSFTWMAIEAMHLYLLLIKVFNIYIKHYMVKLSLIGWGVPAVVVGGLLTVHNIRPFYGTLEMTLTDTDRTNSICWIKEPIILYGVTLSYFVVVFLFNLGILITVSKQIFRLQRTRSRFEKMPVWKDAGTVLGLMFLLGTTWGLAFFTSGYTIYPLLYLFCIFNSMQGFYIFVWMCATTMKNRRQSLQSKTKSTLDASR